MQFFYSVLRVECTKNLRLFVNTVKPRVHTLQSCLSSIFSESVRTHNMSSVDIGDMRVKYKERDESFTEDDLVSKSDPIAQFTAWFEEAKKCVDIIEPNAMCIATSTKSGTPSARMVLLKGYGPEGFKFFTNYESRKGGELAENPQASILFYWPPFNRQVRIEGKVTKTPESESIEYFNRRPLGSRVSAAISPQSKQVPSRQYLVDAAAKLMESGEVERPAFWGGYLLRHEQIEFWQGQSDRLHDRIVFNKTGDTWSVQRIGP